MKPLRTVPNGVIEKVALLDFNDQRQVAFARTRGQTLAYTLGGKIELGETHEDTLVRELKEEGGVDIIRGSIRFYFMFEGSCHGYVEGTILRMWCYTADYTGSLEPRSEIEEIVYLDDGDIGKERTTEMGDKILDHLTFDNLIGPRQD
jgi:8-oxo-dGTP diphosphatase